MKRFVIAMMAAATVAASAHPSLADMRIGSTRTTLRTKDQGGVDADHLCRLEDRVAREASKNKGGARQSF